MTLQQLKNMHKGYFFSESTMRFFNSRIGETIYEGKGGIFFVTSEKFDWKSPRLFTVRQYIRETDSIETVSEFQQFKNRETAHNFAKRLAHPKD